jgi:hypothetical protein
MIFTVAPICSLALLHHFTHSTHSGLKPHLHSSSSNCMLLGSGTPLIPTSLPSRDNCLIIAASMLRQADPSDRRSVSSEMEGSVAIRKENRHGLLPGRQARPITTTGYELAHARGPVSPCSQLAAFPRKPYGYGRCYSQLDDDEKPSR